MVESESTALPLGDTPIHSLLLAGVARIELACDEIKTRCLTTWRYPYTANLVATTRIELVTPAL